MVGSTQISSEGLNIGLVGATGVVGTEMLRVLEQRQFPVKSLKAFASERSVGNTISFAGKEVTILPCQPEMFADLDVVLMSAGGATSKALAPTIAETGAVVIDNSSAWRMDPEVPLVVPEVNAHAIAEAKHKNIIANPNCSTIQMVVALKPLHDAFGLTSVIVSTYQAVSGAGKSAMDELSEQVRALFNSQDPEPKKFDKPIAFDCLPHIDVLMDDRFTKEEHKMRLETRKIMGLSKLDVQPTCVRVPVFNGHAESVYCRFSNPVEVAQARQVLEQSPGVVVVDPIEDGAFDYPTQRLANGEDATYVGRIRQDADVPDSLHMWVVSDNLRKGAATNAVQIAELWARDYR